MTHFRNHFLELSPRRHVLHLLVIFKLQKVQAGKMKITWKVLLCEKVYLILMKERKSASWACFRQLLLCKIWQRETDRPKRVEKKIKNQAGLNLIWWGMKLQVKLSKNFLLLTILQHKPQIKSPKRPKKSKDATPQSKCLTSTVL